MAMLAIIAILAIYSYNIIAICSCYMDVDPGVPQAGMVIPRHPSCQQEYRRMKDSTYRHTCKPRRPLQ